jgi:PAS domain S-box-containing protein
MTTTDEYAGKAQQATILIVDDNPANLEVLAEYLTNVGFQVMTARTGEIGLTLAQRDPPHLILLDIVLPGIDGVETCRRLKADETTREIPVIFMTVVDHIEDKVKGLAVGGVDYITKPFQAEEVLARCRTHLTLYQLQRDLRDFNRILEDKVAARTAELAKVNRAYRALSNCNQALLHATDEADLLQDICRIVKHDCNYKQVWIGFADQDGAMPVQPIAQAGFEDVFFEMNDFPWAKIDQERNPIRIAIRTQRLVIHQDVLTNPMCAPWRDEAIKQGYAASAVLPLLTKGLVLGTMNIYSTLPDAFAPEEADLLMELASDLAYGILSLQGQAEREHMARALFESEARYRLLVENMNDGLIVVDQNMAISYTNPRFCDLVGYTSHDLLGQPISSFLDTANQEIVKEQMILRRKGERSVYDLDLITKDGRRISTQVSASPLLDAQHEYLGSFGVITDITERQQMEEARRERDKLQAALDKEIEISAIKNNMMRTISHEFRTPLTIISNASHLLTHYHERLTSEQSRKHLSIIGSQVNKLDQMVGEIVSAVRNVFSDFAFHPAPMDLELFGQLALTELQSTIGAKHQMTFEYEGQLQNVLVDERLVKRILTNLLSNAIKYSPEDTLICLRITQETDTIVIHVIDQGLGISAEDQKRLFEPFFRASNVETVSGIGLGLSIVRDCVTLHQGTISVESEVNKGTTFTVCLPMHSRATQ